MSDEIDINLILHKLHKYQKKLENAERNGGDNLDIYRQKIHFYYEQLGGGCSRLFGWSKFDKDALHLKIFIMKGYIVKNSKNQLNPDKIHKYHSCIILLSLLSLISDYTKKCNYFEKFNKYHFKLEASKKVKPKPPSRETGRRSQKVILPSINPTPKTPELAYLEKIRAHPLNSNINYPGEYKIQGSPSADTTTAQSNEYELIELSQTPTGNDIIYDLPAFIAVVLLYIASNSNECITNPKVLLHTQLQNIVLKNRKISMVDNQLTSNKKCIISKWFNLLQNRLNEEARLGNPELQNDILLGKICDYFAELINGEVKDYPEIIKKVKQQLSTSKQLPPLFPEWMPSSEGNRGRKYTVFNRPQVISSSTSKKLTELSLEELRALLNDRTFLDSHRGSVYDEARLNINALKYSKSSGMVYQQGMVNKEAKQAKQVSVDPIKDFILNLIRQKEEEENKK